jgi:Spy/CpxP family protein refolding chaperone
MKKQILLTGLIVFLIITNVVTIATVWIHTGKPEASDQSPGKASALEVPGAVPESLRVQYFTRELNLDGDQQDQFRNIQREYMRTARSISSDMTSLRDQLLQTMDQENPDSTRLNELSEMIGAKHTELKKLTVTYYLGLKAICNPDQQEHLYELIRKIIRPDGEVQLPEGEGWRKGGRGQGRGPWWIKQKDSVTN